VSRSSIPRLLRDLVLARDEGRCRYCRLAQHGHGATFHIDHVHPRSRGGSTSADNLVLQCPNCSLRKADKVAATDPNTGQLVPLFHPLKQAWEDHFRLQSEGTCLGMTPIGRATVDALQMNATIPRFARACQIMLGLLLAS
jgi:HNH endonuclease